MSIPQKSTIGSNVSQDMMRSFPTFNIFIQISNPKTQKKNVPTPAAPPQRWVTFSPVQKIPNAQKKRTFQNGILSTIFTIYGSSSLSPRKKWLLVGENKNESRNSTFSSPWTDETKTASLWSQQSAGTETWPTSDWSRWSLRLSIIPFIEKNTHWNKPEWVRTMPPSSGLEK